MPLVKTAPNPDPSSDTPTLWSLLIALCIASGFYAARPARPTDGSPNPAAYAIGPLLYQNNFDSLSDFTAELEAPGTLTVHGHTAELDVPKGATLWLNQQFTGPLLITYEARCVRTDPPGPNDRVSDLNCFWMATDPRNPADFFNVKERTGAFATYNQLQTYYVGQGGNTNTTTRFRRYIGNPATRPLLPEHDLSAPNTLLTPNQWQTITLVACGPIIEYYCDNRRLFTYIDPAPYKEGYFGIRTTFNHLELRRLRIYRLVAPHKRQ